MTRKSVEGGHCMMPDTVGCALTKSECDDPLNFFSSRQMQSGPVNAHSGGCRWQSTVKGTTLGKCTTEDGEQTECASNIDACPNWDGLHLQAGWAHNDTRRGWEGPVQECTVETTSFGRCGNGVCAWSHEHCTVNTTWQPFDENCTCDQVQVGACGRVKPDGEQEVFCAVSEDGCDEEQYWITREETMREAGFDCFLCREESPPATNSSSNLGLIAEDFESLDFEAVGMGGNEVGIGGNNSQTVVIVVAILGALLAFALIGAVGWKAFTTRRDVKRAVKNKEKETPPVTTIIPISENSCNDAEAGNGSEMDDVSVLSEE